MNKVACIPSFFHVGKWREWTVRCYRSHGVVVSTQDFESCDPSSNLGGTSSSQMMNPLIFAVYTHYT